MQTDNITINYTCIHMLTSMQTCTNTCICTCAHTHHHTHTTHTTHTPPPHTTTHTHHHTPPHTHTHTHHHTLHCSPEVVSSVWIYRGHSSSCGVPHLVLRQHLPLSGWGRACGGRVLEATTSSSKTVQSFPISYTDCAPHMQESIVITIRIIVT